MWGLEREHCPLNSHTLFLLCYIKKGDKASLHNWRPISLLNIDYKIVASVLCQRVKRIISYIILDDQSGFIKKELQLKMLD